MRTVKLNVSVGEAADKITILKLKIVKIGLKHGIEDARVQSCTLEAGVLRDALRVAEIDYDTLITSDPFVALAIVNKQLWDVEDMIRVLLGRVVGTDDAERYALWQRQLLGRCIEVPTLNDARAKYKQELNVMFDSAFAEVKSYEGFELGDSA